MKKDRELDEWFNAERKPFIDLEYKEPISIEDEDDLAEIDEMLEDEIEDAEEFSITDSL